MAAGKARRPSTAAAQEFYGWHAERGHAPQWTRGGGVACESCGEQFPAPERWRPAPGWPAYDVSSLGRVRSMPRILSDGRRAGGVILRQFPDAKGYMRVTLRSGTGRKSTRRVHVLVAVAFLGRRPPGMVILHRDDDHSRNGVTDLRYGTPEANVAERVKRERRTERKRGRGRTVGTPPGTGAGS